MKRTMKTWALVAVAAMGLTACQNDFEEQVEAKDSVVVTFVADSAESRTTVDTTGEKPVFAWEESNETFAVLEQTDALAEATSVEFENVDGKAKITATLDTNSGKAEYKYVAIYPESNYLYNSESIEAANLYLPAEQYMYYPNSYDPNADLLVSEVVTTSAQPTEAQMVRFTRLAAVAKLSLKNLGLELGDKVEKVVFTANGKDLAGTVIADLNNPHEFTVEEGESSVTVTTSATDVYFTLLPTTLEAGDNYTVTVFTEKYLYVKQGTIPAEKSLTFEAGKVTRFGVNMDGVAPSKKWVLVKEVSGLKQGDVVAIVAKNYNVVMGKQGNNYPVAAKVEAIKYGDYLYHPITNVADDMIQPLTLMKRDNERTAFDFYNDVDYDGDTSVGFVFANGTNYSPKLQAYCDVNTLFDVTIADGVATLTANEITGTYKYWRYYHSSTVSSRKFDMTSSAITDEKYMLCLYRLEGTVGTIPTVAANVTVPAADKPVVIAEEGAAEATAIDAVVFNYVGDWNIEVSDNAEWLEVSYADGKLSYTAEVNTGAPREATVTITAKLEGQTDLTWTFNVLQKGVPQEISIAEFMSKKSDVNTTYKLTGKITEMTSSSSGTYKLTDGTNEVTVTYLYTDGGDQVYNNKETIGLQVGDVMTVTTVAATSTAGKGGSSAYPSIYKGHYGLTASAGVAADYTGGAVTIEVTTRKGGSMTFPEAVVATMPESDYAALTYDGGDTATVTFTSENTTSDAREATVTFTYGDTSVEVTVQQG
ncbi:MAG: BACON domain-containing protein, partial [Tidjanibacter sp.]|nr:BACON domain-containing protein [Tidjanibacter sp.]